MKLFKLFISIITSVLLFANFSLAEKWDMALAYGAGNFHSANACLLYTSPSPRDRQKSRMPSSA